ncbi:hypothetical protein A3Q32_21015 [Alcanivorax sp. KX64203]|nr:hypothetical protein A3Q32_21015 [Alcanivorax sp. KX64203]
MRAGILGLAQVVALHRVLNIMMAQIPITLTVMVVILVTGMATPEVEISSLLAILISVAAWGSFIVS